jgi:hypothetical protein
MGMPDRYANVHSQSSQVNGAQHVEVNGHVAV